ncbi:TPA: hypothetical protein HA241_03710 [Candidatus Woesearchaeota archaeon]|nr:hypothetical protein [Candidatus Woesearchaeota archaeon]
MQVTIQSKKNNLFLQRTEVEASMQFSGATPSNIQVAAEVAKALKTTPELVVIKNIRNRFGLQTASVNAVAYDSAEVKAKTEPLTKHLKKKLEESKKKEGGQ